jgi:hypothetical protein
MLDLNIPLENPLNVLHRKPWLKGSLPRFQVCSVSEKECEYLRRCKECVRNSKNDFCDLFVFTGFVCDLLAYGLVDCAASPKTRGKI